VFLLLFFTDQDADLVVQGDDWKGFQEEGHPTLRLIVDDPFKPVFIFGLDEEDVSPVS